MQWNRITETQFPIGELMMIEGNAVLCYRDCRHGPFVYRPPWFRPRPIRVGDFKGFVVHVDMHGRVGWPLLRLYAVGTGTISAADNAGYARGLATRHGVREAWLEFRADPWFINEIWTPSFPVFDPRGPIPTAEGFKATRTPYCFTLRQATTSARARTLPYCLADGDWTSPVR
jgi:hypothetical protein